MNKRIHITIRDVKLMGLDAYCKAERYSRSELILLAIEEFMRTHPHVGKLILAEPLTEKEEEERLIAQKCDNVFCKSFDTQLTEGVGVDNEGNEISEQKWLCYHHINSARKAGQKVTILTDRKPIV